MRFLYTILISAALMQSPAALADEENDLLSAASNRMAQINREPTVESFLSDATPEQIAEFNQTVETFIELTLSDPSALGLVDLVNVLSSNDSIGNPTFGTMDLRHYVMSMNGEIYR